MTFTRKDHADHVPDRPMVEIIRQREVLKYASNILSNIVVQEHGAPDLSKSRTASDNTTLTAFAQLCACQTGTSRCLVSFFDQKYQYVVAEATPALPLVPGIAHGDLLFCGTAFPRRHAICEHALFKPNQFPTSDNDDLSHLPLLVVPDLMEDGYFDARSKPCAVADPEEPTRFYASVPIQTAKGVNIGVVCVMCPHELTTWSDTHRQVLRNISGSIMSYLEGNRASARSRSQRMNKGISAFMEENFNLAGARLRPQAADLMDGGSPGVSSDSANLDGPRSRDTDHSDRAAIFSSGSDVADAHTPTSVFSDDTSTDDMSQTAEPAGAEEATAQTGQASFFEADPETARKSTIQSIFTNAAGKICQAMDTDGCLFLDAAPKGFGALKSRVSLDPIAALQSSASTSSDEGTDGSYGGGAAEPCATVLGFATSEGHGGGVEPEHVTRHAAVASRLLASFIKRYPRGKLFNFDGSEALNPTDSSEGDLLSPYAEGWGSSTRHGGHGGHGGHGRHKARARPSANPWVKRNEGRDILRVFPGARSVAFVPVWDPRKNRWYAGGFVYSRHPRYAYTMDGELSYLRVLCILAMTETMRHELALDEKAKFDALSSMSHELRSPLHGIILGIEMLNETDLTVSQGDTVHTLEACGRTLTDTLDHLLDYAKVNNFHTTARPLARGITQGRTIQAGMMTLKSNVHIDVLAEEVMDSIFAGFNFQFLSIAQLKKLDSVREPDVAANLRLDGLRAEEELGPGYDALATSVAFKDVMVMLDAAPDCAWVFDTQPGAIRRIVMNLFGNALKYTERGLVVVSLTQRSPKTGGINRERQVTITVSDTGCGISEDFLQYKLFKPFSQENPLNPGTGLGLSLVKRIASQLHGRMSVQSRVGAGTSISVTLPLSVPLPAPADHPAGPAEDAFARQVRELSGLRIRVLGFGCVDTLVGGERHDTQATIGSMCRDWLGLEVLPGSGGPGAVPDFVLASEDAFALRGRDPVLSRLPCVVVCVNALVAHQRSAQGKAYKDIVEFIYQPVGPRKLAKVLSLAFNRWAAVNAEWVSPGAESPAAVLTQATAEPRGHQRGAGRPPLPTRPSIKSSGSSDSGVQMGADWHDELPIRPKLVRAPSPTEAGAETRVLLVEDNPINLKILSAVMNKFGLKFHTATNGQEAVDAYKRDPRRCVYILTDVSMPVMDGFEATRQIRAHERACGLDASTIIALSGLASSQSQKEAFGSGIDLFLTKPVKFKELRAILRSRGLF